MSSNEIVVEKFPNGLTLIVEPMKDVRSAAFSLLVPAGSVYDPVGECGTAAVLTDWIIRGAGDLDTQELSNALDNLGLQRNEATGGTHLSFGGAAVASNLPEALRVYANIVRKPWLPDEEFEASVAGVEQTLHAVEDEPRQKVMIELRKRCYDAPWGLPVDGTLAGVQALTPDKVRAHYQRCVRPGDAVLGVAGAVDPKTIIAVVQEAFGDWQDHPAPQFATSPGGPRRDHIHHESTQTQIGIAYNSVPYRNPAYYRAWAAVGVLSDGMSSRLFTEVREKRGLCYSVYATLHSLRDEGRVLAYAGTTVERAQETLDVLLQELIRLEQGIEPQELARCQARAKSSLIMQQESSGARASSLARDWYHLGRVTTLEEVRKGIEELTVPAILEHLREHPARDFTILTLGPQPLEVRHGVS